MENDIKVVFDKVEELRTNEATARQLRRPKSCARKETPSPT